MRSIFFLLSFFLVAVSSAQNVTGSYSNGFYSNANFIKNPNAQLNAVSDVSSDDSSTLARSTTTPLYGLTEYTVTDAGAWSIKWDANTFNSGMNGRTCEAKVLVRGSAGTATLAVLDGATVLYSATGTPNATTTTPISVVFPCGAPTTPKLKLSGGAAITGSLEVGAAYLGLAVSVASGTITTPWQPYTATVEGLGAASVTSSWRRVGDTLHVIFSIVTGTPTADLVNIYFPTGLERDSTKTGNNTVVGNYGTSLANQNGSVVVYSSTSSNYPRKVGIVRDVDSIATGSLGTSFSSAIFLTGNFSVPISGWAATDIATPEGTLVEFASNSSTTDANDSTSFVNGPTGSIGIIGVTNLTGTRFKRVRFSTPIKPEDSITFEIFDSGANAWIPVSQNSAGTLSYSRQNTIEYGIFLGGVSSTDIDVYFARYAIPSGATYGVAGTEWSTVSSRRWRVKKTPGTSNQSVFISSPIVADPVTNTVKAKNTSGTDVLSIAGGTGAYNLGIFSGASELDIDHNFGFGKTRSFNLIARTNYGLLKWINKAGADRVEIGYEENAGGYMSGSSANDVFIAANGGATLFTQNRGSTTSFKIASSGAITAGPPSGLTSPHQFNAGTATARIITLNQTDAANNNAIISTYDAGTLMGSFGSSTAYPFSIFSNTDSVAFHIPAGLGDGTLTLTGKVVGISSDSRLKDEVSKPKHAGLSEILKLQTHYYTWKDKAKGDSVHFGFYSQEVGKHIPEAMGKPGEDGMYGFYDRPVIAALVNGMKEQQAQINCLVNANNKKEREACVAGVK